MKIGFRWTLACTGLAFSLASAQAAPLVINTGQDFNLSPNGSTTTAGFQALGYNGSRNTSIFLGDPAVSGTTVVATNIPAIMTFYGFSAGTKTTTDGGSANFAFASTPAQNNFDALVNPASPDLNGFTDGASRPYGSGATAGTGLGGAFGLSYSYQLVGQTFDAANDGTVDGVRYSAGIVSVYYQSAVNDPNNGKEVLRLFANGSGPARGGLAVNGYLDFSYAAGDPFIQNFFSDAGKTLYQMWQDDPVSTTFSMDFGDFGVPGPGALWNTGASLMAQETMSGNLYINGAVLQEVPEPASLALFALGLAGLAANRRRHRGGVA